MRGSAHKLYPEIGVMGKTGWTGVVARLLDLFGRIDKKAMLEETKGTLLTKMVREQTWLASRSPRSIP